MRKTKSKEYLSIGWVVLFRNGNKLIYTENAFNNTFYSIMNDSSIASFEKWTYLTAAVLKHPDAVVILK